MNLRYDALRHKRGAGYALSLIDRQTPMTLVSECISMYEYVYDKILFEY